LAKSGNWDWETIFCRHYRSIFNHVTKSACRVIKFRDKMQNKGNYAIHGHRRQYQSKAGTGMQLPISD